MKSLIVKLPCMMMGHNHDDDHSDSSDWKEGPTAAHAQRRLPQFSSPSMDRRPYRSSSSSAAAATAAGYSSSLPSSSPATGALYAI